MARLVTDPVDLELDSFGDLIVSREFTFTTALKAIAQEIRIRLQTFRGEWFLDLDTGIPYFETDDDPGILGRPYDDERIRRIFRLEILAVEGVVRLKTLRTEFDKSTREVSIRWEAETEFGDTDGVESVTV